MFLQAQLARWYVQLADFLEPLRQELFELLSPADASFQAFVYGASESELQVYLLQLGLIGQTCDFRQATGGAWVISDGSQQVAIGERHLNAIRYNRV